MTSPENPNAIPSGDDAAIQSPTTTGGDRSDERSTAPEEDAVTDEERRSAKANDS